MGRVDAQAVDLVLESYMVPLILTRRVILSERTSENRELNIFRISCERNSSTALYFRGQSLVNSRENRKAEDYPVSGFSLLEGYHYG